MAINDPEVKVITFEGLTYKTIQVFEIVKITVEGHRLTKEEFSPHEIYNETFEK